MDLTEQDLNEIFAETPEVKGEEPAGDKGAEAKEGAEKEPVGDEKPKDGPLSDEIEKDAEKTEKTAADDADKEKLAPRFAALARKQRELIEAQQSFRREKSSFEEEKAKLVELRSELAEVASLLKKEPLKALEMLGISYTELSERVLREGSDKIDPKELKESFEELLERRLAERDKQWQERQEKREAEYNLGRMRAGEIGAITSLFKAGTFPLLGLREAENPGIVAESVLHVVEEHYKQTLSETGTGEALDYREVLDSMENGFRRQAEADYGALNSAGGFQRREASASSEEKGAGQANGQGGRRISEGGPRTLTNLHSGEVARRSGDQRSQEERIRDIIKEFSQP